MTIAPIVAQATEADRGPVMVQIEYQIDVAKMADFVQTMQSLRRIRRRDGAVSWALYSDARRPDVMVESFVLESWLEHLRQHERVTEADRIEQSRVQGFHIGAEPPLVRHLIAPAR